MVTKKCFKKEKINTFRKRNVKQENILNEQIKRNINI